MKNSLLFLLLSLLTAQLSAQPLFTVASNVICGVAPTISVPSNTFNTYSWNMGNGVTGNAFLPPNTIYSGVGTNYTISRTVTASNPFKVISSISVLHTGGFQNCSFEDSHPDYYLVIKNSAGTTLHTTPVNSNIDAPSLFNLSGILANASLLVTVMEYDPSTFCVNLNMGTVALPANVNSGNYQTSSGSVIISVTTQMVTSATYSKVVTVSSPTMTINRTCATSGLAATLSPSLSGTAYQWSNGANTSSIAVNTAGTYSVTVTTSSGCTAKASSAVAFSPKPLVSCNGTSLTCTNYTSFIRWLNSSNVVVSNSLTYTPTVSGTYYAQYWAGSNCPVKSSGINYPTCTIVPSIIATTTETAMDNRNTNTVLNITPNPSATGIFHLSLPAGTSPTDVKMEVMEITGKTLLPLRWFENRLDLSQYPNGIYLLRWEYAGNTATQKLLITR